MPSKWLIVAIGLAGCATGKQPAESSSASSATFCMPCTMPCVSPCEPAVATRFNPAPGSFAAPQSVTLSSPTPGAVIRYTTDGTKPTERSPAYAGAIPVERTTTITTIAQVPGLPPSKVASATYTIAPPPPVAVTPRRLQLNQRVLFRTGTATLDPRSAPVLDAVAGALQEHHEIDHLIIEGHADARGTDAFNDKLSKDRADAVRGYLIDKGVEPDRLEAQGFGSSQPIADNSTREGREANRRVDFVAVVPSEGGEQTGTGTGQ